MGELRHAHVDIEVEEVHIQVEVRAHIPVEGVGCAQVGAHGHIQVVELCYTRTEAAKQHFLWVQVGDNLRVLLCVRFGVFYRYLLPFL